MGLNDLLKKGVEKVNPKKTVELTESNNFIYDFDNIEDFYVWSQSVLETINDEDAK